MEYNYDDLVQKINDMTAEDPLGYLRVNAPDLVADWEQAAVLFQKHSNVTPSEKLQLIFEARDVIAQMQLNRPRDGSTPQDPYDVYRQTFTDKQVSESLFRAAFDLTRRVALTGDDLRVSQNSLNAVEGWRALGETQETILKYVATIATTPQLALSLYQLHQADHPGQDPSARRNEFVRIARQLGKNGYYEDAVCAACLEKDDNDVALECGVLYHRFFVKVAVLSAGGCKPLNILIINPSAHFLRKCLLDRQLRQCVSEATFAVASADVCTIYGTIAAQRSLDNYHYITLQNLDAQLKGSATAPDLTLLFTRGITEYPEHLRILQDKQAHTLMCFGPDRDIRCLGDAISNYAVRQVCLYPSGINDATWPQRKMALTAEYGQGKGARAEILSYALERSDAQYLVPRPYQADVSLDAAALEKVRATYAQRQDEYLRRTDAVRSGSRVFAFSPEITIYYNVSWGKSCPGDCLPRIEAYVYPPDVRKTPAGGRKTRIQKSVKRTRRVPLGEAEAWLANEYTYGSKERGDDKGNTVRQAIAPIYRDAYRGKPLSLKTLLYIHPEVESDLPLKAAQELKQLLESELGELRTNQLAQSTVMDYLSQRLGSERALTTALASLSKLVDAAIADGNCSDNVFAAELARYNRRYRRDGSVTGNLRKRTLSLAEAQTIYAAIVERITSGQSEYVGLLLRLVMGLESNVVCALQWRDFMSVSRGDGTTLYQLIIRRQLRNDGSAYVPFVKPASCRVLPCPQVVATALLAERDRQSRALGPGGQPIGDGINIVQSSVVAVPGAATLAAVSPRTLGEMGRSLVSQLGLPDDIIVVPDDKNGTVETNLAYYAGDILTSTHRRFCLGECGFTAGEFAYWRGNTLMETFSRNYCDYTNYFSQLILAVKIERWAAIISNSPQAQTCRETTMSNVTTASLTSTAFCRAGSELELTIIPDGDGVDPITLHVESKYGFWVGAVKIEKGGIDNG